MLGSFLNLIRLVRDHYVIFEYELFCLSFTYSFVLLLLKKEVIQSRVFFMIFHENYLHGLSHCKISSESYIELYVSFTFN